VRLRFCAPCNFSHLVRLVCGSGDHNVERWQQTACVGLPKRNEFYGTLLMPLRTPLPLFGGKKCWNLLPSTAQAQRFVSRGKRCLAVYLSTFRSAPCIVQYSVCKAEVFVYGFVRGGDHIWLLISSFLLTCSCSWPHAIRMHASEHSSINNSKLPCGGKQS